MSYGDYVEQPTKDQRKALKDDTFKGWSWCRPPRGRRPLPTKARWTA